MTNIPRTQCFLLALLALTTSERSTAGQERAAPEQPVDQPTSADQDPVLAQILADWQRRQERARSVEYVIEGRVMHPRGRNNDSMLPVEAFGVMPPDDYWFDMDLRLLLDFDRNWIRKELRDEVFLNGGPEHPSFYHPQFVVQLYDGSQLQEFRPHEENMSDRWTPGDTQPELLFMRDEFDGMLLQPSEYPVFFGHGIVGNRRLWFRPSQLRTELDPEFLRVHGVGSLDGRECFILRTPNLSPRFESFYEFWVDRDRESAVVRWLRYNRGQVAKRLDIAYRETEFGWLPASWAATSFRNGSLWQQQELRVTSFTINPEVEEDQFHIHPTPGMVVEDYRTGEWYIAQGANEPQIDVRELIAASDQATDGAARALVVIAAVLLVGAAVAVCLALLRRRRRTLR